MAKLPRRKCAHKACRQWFHPVRDGQVVCSFDCASAIGKEQTAKAREASKQKEAQRQRTEEKAGRQRRAARRNELKPIRHWVQMTQRAVNDWRREMLLTAGHGCISCGTKPLLPGMPGITAPRPPHHSFALTRTISGSNAPPATSTNPGTSRRTAPPGRIDRRRARSGAGIQQRNPPIHP